MDPMLSEVLRHAEWGDKDMLPLIWLVMACLLAMYLLYNVIVAWLLEWTTISVKLSLHVRRDTFPLCSKCAGGALRTLWQQFDFSFCVPLGEPAKIRFINDFRSEPDNPSILLEDHSGVNRVAIHDCGGIQDILFEVSADRGHVMLLCLPSKDYTNIMLEEKESFFIEPNKLMNFIRMCPRNVYVAWGRLVLSQGYHLLPSPTYQSWIVGKSL